MKMKPLKAYHTFAGKRSLEGVHDHTVMRKIMIFYQHLRNLRTDRKWMALFVLTTTALLLTSFMPEEGEVNKIKTVVLDAGHGGKDPGNLGTGRYSTTEKQIALDVTLQVGEYIKKAFPDIKVIYTRDKDEFIGLKERTKIANEAKADLFISIHCNSNERSSAKGADTFVMGLHKTEANLRTAQKENAAMLLEQDHELVYDGFDPRSPESMIALSLRQSIHMEQSLDIASLVQTQFRERVHRTDRGVKQAGFWVISFTTMPSILIELGFLTNPQEEDFLQSDEGRSYMASAVYRAFKEYKAEYESLEAASPIVASSENDDDPKETVTQNYVVYKVQIVTASKPVSLQSSNFKGLKNVQEYMSNGMYKYTVGNEETLEEAQEVQKAVREKGYGGAFLVAFKGDQRISLQEAMELAQQKDQ